MWRPYVVFNAHSRAGYYPIGLLTSTLFLPFSLSEAAQTQGHARRPTMGLRRNPRWGLHLYHPQINWSSVRCRRRQNHNKTPRALWRRSRTCTGWTHLDFLIFYSFVLYPLACLPPCLFFTLACSLLVKKEKKSCHT